MKEKFLDEQQRRDAEIQNQYIDDDYCCNEECGCHEENTANNNAAEYDAWWNSLTDKQKQKLFEEADAAELENLERQSNLEQYRKDYNSFKNNTE